MYKILEKNSFTYSIIDIIILLDFALCKMIKKFNFINCILKDKNN